MRARSTVHASTLLLSAGWLLGTGCFLDASPYDGTTGTTVGTGGGTTTGTTGGGGTTSTTSSTSSTGGSTSTSTSTTGGGGAGGATGGGGAGGATGGGGTGGATSTGGGGTGGAGPTDPLSCLDALNAGMVTSGTVTIDTDGPGPELPFMVYCDQQNDGGGWALVHNSVGDPAGATTAFWNIPYSNRFDTKGDPPALGTNHYAGKLYKKGLEYRDDVEDLMGNEVRGVLRATATGINEASMKFLGPTNAGSVSPEILTDHFLAGWSSPDNDLDNEPSNCAVVWSNVTQHYNSCWKYNLGSDADGGADHTDGGWGPHVINSILTKINMVSVVQLQTDGMGGAASRVKRISRFTRW